MTMDSKVGSESEYDKAPFKDNVAKSMPPMTKGATGRNEGNGPQGTGGKSSRYAGLSEKLAKDCGSQGKIAP